MKSLFGSIVFFLLIVSTFSCAQDLKFVKPDSNALLWMNFSITDSIVIVVPDSYDTSASVRNIIERGNSWGDRAIQKKEKDLTDTDLTKHLFYCGSVHHFKTRASFDIPVTLLEDGFSFKSHIFNHPTDAFYYINDEADRFYLLGNSHQAIDQMFRHLLRVYQLYIFRDNEMHYHGKYSVENVVDSVNDLEQLRKIYFKNRESLQFYDLYLAPSCNKDSILNLAHNELDQFIYDLADNLNTDSNNLVKIKTYIYSNRFDLQNFLGIPQEFKMWGLSVNNVIHNYQYDLKVIRHESAHNFILQKIGNNTNNFFVEGFRQYTDYLFSENNYQEDRGITLEHIDLLTTDLIQKDIFFNTPQSYPISGVFVKFIIDKIGLEEFKRIYSNNQIDLDLKTVYNYSLEQLIEEFKEIVSQ